MPSAGSASRSKLPPVPRNGEGPGRRVERAERGQPFDVTRFTSAKVDGRTFRQRQRQVVESAGASALAARFWIC